MTEPPRPPGEGSPGDVPPDPTSPPQSPASYSMPGEAPSPGYAPPPQAPPPGGQKYDAPQYPPGPGAVPPGTPPPGYPPAGGYPPGGGYPPAGGYPPGPGYPPGFGAPPPGYATNDEKTWALIAHFGGILVGFIAPLISLLAKGNESPTVRAHSVEALNFQITWGIATIIAVILAVCSFGILFFLPIATIIVAIVFAIIAGMKANDGVLYRYPMSIRMIK